MQHLYGNRVCASDSDDPIRMQELAELEEAMRKALYRRDVLEIACGSGYWTERAVHAVNRITAIDRVPAALVVARAKMLPPDIVRFIQADASELTTLPGYYNAGLANFWLSHIPHEQIRFFLDILHRRLGPGAVVFMADNVYVEGIGGELIQHPGKSDTYRLRTFSDGTQHEILKNYYLEDQLLDYLGLYTREIHIHMGACYWWLTYQVS